MQKFPEGQVGLVNLPGSGSLLVRAYRLYRANFSEFLSLSLLAFLGVIVDKSLTSFFHYLVRDAAALWKGLVEVGVLSLDILMGYYLAIIFAAMLRAFHEAEHGKPLSLSEAFSYGLSKAPSVFWVGLLMTFALYASVPTVVFFLLFSVWFYFALTVAVLDDQKGIAALLKSRYLTHGLFFRVTGRYFAVAALISLAVAIPYLFLGFGSAWLTITPLLMLAVALVSFPLFMAYEYYRFTDLMSIPRSVPFIAFRGDRAAVIVWTIVGALFFVLVWSYTILSPRVQERIANSVVSFSAQRILPYATELEINLEKLRDFIGTFYFEFEPVETKKSLR